MPQPLPALYTPTRVELDQQQEKSNATLISVWLQSENGSVHLCAIGYKYSSVLERAERNMHAVN